MASLPYTQEKSVADTAATPRSPIVNFLKGFGIIFVVFGHIASPLTNFIFAWHMPLFFFVSGFYIKTEESPVTFLKREGKKIFITFIIFALLGFFATYFRNIVLHRENQDIAKALLDTFLWMDMKHMNNYGFVLWFLPALFWGRFISYTLLRYIKQKLAILLATVFIFAATIYFKTALPFVIDLGMIAALWITVGYFVFNFWAQHIVRYWKYLVLVLPICLLFLPLHTIDLSGRYFSSPAYNVLYSFIVLILLFVASHKVPHENKVSQLCSYLGKNSLFIFVFHPYTNNIAYLFVNRYFENIWYIKYAVSLCLIYLLLVLYRKYMSANIFKYV